MLEALGVFVGFLVLLIRGFFNFSAKGSYWTAFFPNFKYLFATFLLFLPPKYYQSPGAFGGKIKVCTLDAPRNEAICLFGSSVFGANFFGFFCARNLKVCIKDESARLLRKG